MMITSNNFSLLTAQARRLRYRGALQQQIDADIDRLIFNSKGRDFADNFKNRRLWSDSYPGLKSLKTNLKNSYGKLNITIQESTSTKSLKPYINL